MALRPKLEFYRLRLVTHDGEYRTFRDFAVDELYQRRPSGDTQIMNKLFDHFMGGLASDKAKDNSIKKQIKLIKTSSNIHLSNRPVADVKSNIIYGVINGGRFGRNGMMGDASSKSDDTNAFGKDKTILRYYYFLLYLPLDHNEGCLILHSNSKEETIADIFKQYLSRIFKGGGYKRPAVDMFCPKAFLEDFKKKSVIKRLEFKETYLDEVFTTDGMGSIAGQYDVKISITPKGKNRYIQLSDKSRFNSLLSKLAFKRPKNTDPLGSFSTRQAVLNSPYEKSERTFDLDGDNLDIVPVVYLEGNIKKYNDDDTPDFNELNKFCQNLFQEQVLPELRPDLYMGKGDVKR